MVDMNTQRPVDAQVRYVNPEWKNTAEVPRIGSRETRRANTSFQNVKVYNARSQLAAGELDLDRCGFTLCRNEVPAINFRDKDDVVAKYYPIIEKFLLEQTGADRIFIRDHLIRTETPVDFNDGYARFVHCDYNLARLTELSEAVLRQHKVAPQANWTYTWFNTWQPFDNVVENNPLALIDWMSLPLDDVIDYYYTGRGVDSLVAAPVYSPDHRWCYFPQMTPDEVIIFKQMDGRPDRSVYCPHTSFQDPTAPDDCLPRRSIEMRILAVYEDAAS